MPYAITVNGQDNGQVFPLRTQAEAVFEMGKSLQGVQWLCLLQIKRRECEVIAFWERKPIPHRTITHS